MNRQTLSAALFAVLLVHSAAVGVDEVSTRLPQGVPPVLGTWDWAKLEFRPAGYRQFIDVVSEHAPYNILVTGTGGGRDVTEDYVHDQIKQAAAYARKCGLGLAVVLDPRFARTAFQKAYPDELQERLRLRQVDLPDSGQVVVSIDAGPQPSDSHGTYPSQSSRLVRVYSYVRGPQGIEPNTVEDITDKYCSVESATAKHLRAVISCGQHSRGRQACVMAAFTYPTAAVFAPHIIPFERETISRYADVDLAGLVKDEWGFPSTHAGNPTKSDYWYSKFRAAEYAKRTGGRDLLRDCLLMYIGERERDSERQAAINHFFEMSWQRNGAIEDAFYRATKQTFGPSAIVSCHPTTYSYPLGCRLGQMMEHLPVVTHHTKYHFPDSREFERNGLNWWIATRDLAQTDYLTPYCVRTSLAKKWGSAFWYNMFFSSELADYGKQIWPYALAGGRMNPYPVFPYTGEARLRHHAALLRGGLMRAECRIRLLNFICKSPIDCPVAIIFGHACAMNWAGPAYEDVGIGLANSLWRAGFYADLIPSSQIGDKALKVSEDGYIQYGPQRYAAVVLYHPEFERPATAEFFQKAAAGKTALYRIGDWTRDFDGRPFNGNAALPSQMVSFADVNCCIVRVVVDLHKLGIVPQTAATGVLAGTAAPPAKGRNHLIDGTQVIVSGEKQVSGDPIITTFEVKGQQVTFDAVGVAAVRLADDDSLEAMAAGGLKEFQAGKFKISLEKRADIALWRDERAEMQGVLQDWTGPVPPRLAAITKNWLRLQVPPPLTGDK